jgi:hypothetical protein
MQIKLLYSENPGIQRRNCYALLLFCAIHPRPVTLPYIFCHSKYIAALEGQRQPRYNGPWNLQKPHMNAELSISDKQFMWLRIKHRKTKEASNIIQRE